MASLPFDDVYSSAHAGKDTRSQISFGGGAAHAPTRFDTQASAPLGAYSSAARTLQRDGGHGYTLPPDSGPGAPMVSPLRARPTAPQYPEQHTEQRGSGQPVLDYPRPSPSGEAMSSRERALEGRVEQLERQVAHLMVIVSGSGY